MIGEKLVDELLAADQSTETGLLQQRERVAILKTILKVYMLLKQNGWQLWLMI